MVYYDLKMHEESEKMFQETVNGPLGASGVDQKQIKIKILISLASFFLSRAIKENDQEMKDELLKKVRGNLTKSDRYNLNEKTSFVLKGKIRDFCFDFLVFSPGSPSFLAPSSRAFHPNSPLPDNLFPRILLFLPK